MNKKMLKNSKAGRIICRLFGEETGATMMEYVILAVMIAAAVTAAAIYFGSSAKDQMNVAGDAMRGQVKSAETRQSDSVTKGGKGADRASESTAKFSDLKPEGAAGTGTGGK